MSSKLNNLLDRVKLFEKYALNDDKISLLKSIDTTYKLESKAYDKNKMWKWFLDTYHKGMTGEEVDANIANLEKEFNKVTGDLFPSSQPQQSNNSVFNNKIKEIKEEVPNLIDRYHNSSYWNSTQLKSANDLSWKDILEDKFKDLDTISKELDLNSNNKNPIASKYNYALAMRKIELLQEQNKSNSQNSNSKVSNP
jgi:hypothetical protein